MMKRNNAWRFRAIAAAFWILTAASVPILIASHATPVGWDLRVYSTAVRSIRAGHDPYADGIAVQRVFHASTQANNPDIMPPYTYVYSPLTLPVLYAICLAPARLSTEVYWVVYVTGLLAMVWVGWRAAEPSERKMFALLMPVAAFFPGLLQTNVIFSGNLAYILYGTVLAAATLGWRRGVWAPFYLAALGASCFKAPLLSLLLIPVFSARKQWIQAGGTAVAGLALFAVQPLLWPDAFRNYLEAVSLQFRYNHDFGFSPSGLLGDTLYFFGIAYTLPSLLFYAAYAACVLAMLYLLSRKFLEGEFTLEQWVPVLLIGVVLLNPRIKEYDVAPLGVPMAMVAWRLFARGTTRGRAVLEMSLFFLAINGIASNASEVWKPSAGVLLISSFVAGSWQLLTLHASQDNSLGQVEPTLRFVKVRNFALVESSGQAERIGGSLGEL